MNSLQDCLQLCAYFSKYHLHNSRQKELMTICQLCSQVSKLSQLNKAACGLSDPQAAMRISAKQWFPADAPGQARLALQPTGLSD